MRSLTPGGASLVGMLLIAASARAQEPAKARPGSPVTVTVHQLEENAERYKGQQIRTQGEVERVLGPHLFTIDERNWIDFDGETLVFLPAPLAALVQDGNPVTVTGTMRTMVETEIDTQRGWFGNDPKVRVELQRRPVLVADAVTSTQDNNDMTMRIEMDGTTSPRPATLTDLGPLAKSNDRQLVGRWVDVQSARVESMAQGGGFWVSSGTDRLFVVPATDTKVSPGQTVGLAGVVLEMPEGMRNRLGDKATTGEAIYLYVSRLTHAS